MIEILDTRNSAQYSNNINMKGPMKAMYLSLLFFFISFEK